MKCKNCKHNVAQPKDVKTANGDVFNAMFGSLINGGIVDCTLKLKITNDCNLYLKK